jgi:hypothetical protein
MTQQACKTSDSAPAIVPLRTLAELGDEGTGRLAATDLTPRLPFPAHPGWYERYWYGDRPRSRWGLLANTATWLCGEVPRVGEAARRAAARTISGLVQGWRVT